MTSFNSGSYPEKYSPLLDEQECFVINSSAQVGSNNSNISSNYCC